MCRNMFRVDDDDDGKICSEGRKKRREISETNFFPTFHACYSIDHPRRGVIVKQESVYANRFVNLHRCFFFLLQFFLLVNRTNCLEDSTFHLKARRACIRCLVSSVSNLQNQAGERKKMWWHHSNEQKKQSMKNLEDKGKVVSIETTCASWSFVFWKEEIVREDLHWFLKSKIVCEWINFLSDQDFWRKKNSRKSWPYRKS